MVEYRTFHNSDPPRLLALWHSCQLGRGAAEGITTDAFEYLVYAQPYFDRNGLIIACEGEQVVGLVHAGFGTAEDETKLDHTQGTICLVLVHPDHRRKGIGRELVSRAEAYLAEQGTTSPQAGCDPTHDPFYVGLYGGTRPSGFLESEPNAAAFLQAVGYQPAEQHQVFQRNLETSRDPVNFQMMGVKRKTQVVVQGNLALDSWWWGTRFGRLESARFMLQVKATEAIVARLTILGLDLYLPKWQQRAVGITSIFVTEEERRQGYGQTLITEVCRHLRQELITLVEMHCPTDNEPAVKMLQAAGFESIDTGTVFRKPA